jgi:type II secretory pathway component PulC
VASSFIKFLVAPLLRNESEKSGKSRIKYTEMSKYINGNTTITTSYINAIEKLTGRSDIKYLTMNNWKGIFQNNIIDQHRKWCPVCLNMTRRTNVLCLLVRSLSGRSRHL